jgi:hypothetical protein
MLGETLYTSRYYAVACVHRYLQWSRAWSHNMCQCEQTEVMSARMETESAGSAGAEVHEVCEVRKCWKWWRQKFRKFQECWKCRSGGSPDSTKKGGKREPQTVVSPFSHPFSHPFFYSSPRIGCRTLFFFRFSTLFILLIRGLHARMHFHVCEYKYSTDGMIISTK